MDWRPERKGLDFGEREREEVYTCVDERESGLSSFTPEPKSFSRTQSESTPFL